MEQQPSEKPLDPCLACPKALQRANSSLRHGNLFRFISVVMSFVTAVMC